MSVGSCAAGKVVPYCHNSLRLLLICLLLVGDLVAIALTAINSEDLISMTNEEHNRAERASARGLLTRE
jgi:hypothetical protein